MDAATLAHTITMRHGALDDRFTLDLIAEKPSTGLKALMRSLKRMDTLAFRIAVPPLTIWGALYSLVEYLM